MLAAKFDELKRQFARTEVPLPDVRGYRVIPAFEFWQGGANRLHDRYF